MAVGMVVIPGIDGEDLVGRLGRDQEALRLPGLPRVLEVAVAAGAFVAEIAPNTRHPH